MSSDLLKEICARVLELVTPDSAEEFTVITGALKGGCIWVVHDLPNGVKTQQITNQMKWPG